MNSDDLDRPLATTGKRKNPSGSRADSAGPSRKPTSNRPAQKKRIDEPTREPESGSEMEDIRRGAVKQSEVEDDEVLEEGSKRPQARGNSKKPPQYSNGKPGSSASNATTKGKGRDGDPQAKKRGSAKIETVDEDEGEGDDMDEGAQGLAAAYNRAGAANGKKPSTGRQATRSAQETKLLRENERLRDEIERMRKHVDDFKKLERELIEVRHTEPEALLEEQAVAHQREIRAHKQLISDLQVQLEKKEPLLRGTSGKKAVINLLTREEADEEVKVFKHQANTLKAEVDRLKQALQAKDQEIIELKQQNQEFKVELDAEIARSKSLATKAPKPLQSGPRNGGALGGDDPKSTQVLRLYEDLTNVMVLNVKFEDSKYHREKDIVFNCVYTYMDPLNPTPEGASPPSLNFLLKFCQEPPQDSGQAWRPGNPLVEVIHFQPKLLDKEAPETVERLGFLQAPFAFDRPQLCLLVKTLQEAMNDSEEDEEEDDDEMQS